MEQRTIRHHRNKVVGSLVVVLQQLLLEEVDYSEDNLPTHKVVDCLVAKLQLNPNNWQEVVVSSVNLANNPQVYSANHNSHRPQVSVSVFNNHKLKTRIN